MSSCIDGKQAYPLAGGPGPHGFDGPSGHPLNWWFDLLLSGALRLPAGVPSPGHGLSLLPISQRPLISACLWCGLLCRITLGEEAALYLQSSSSTPFCCPGVVSLAIKSWISFLLILILVGFPPWWSVTTAYGLWVWGEHERWRCHPQQGEVASLHICPLNTCQPINYLGSLFCLKVN